MEKNVVWFNSFHQKSQMKKTIIKQRIKEEIKRRKWAEKKL